MAVTRGPPALQLTGICVVRPIMRSRPVIASPVCIPTVPGNVGVPAIPISVGRIAIPVGVTWVAVVVVAITGIAVAIITRVAVPIGRSRESTADKCPGSGPDADRAPTPPAATGIAAVVAATPAATMITAPSTMASAPPSVIAAGMARANP